MNDLDKLKLIQDLLSQILEDTPSERVAEEIAMAMSAIEVAEALIVDGTAKDTAFCRDLRIRYTEAPKVPCPFTDREFTEA